MSPAPSPADSDAETPALHRLLDTGLALLGAAALFVLVSGVHAGGGSRDSRLLVAQCWQQIEEKQAGGADIHGLRAGCQALESGFVTPVAKPAATVVASQE